MSIDTESGQVQESYALFPPFAYALIQIDPKTKQIIYSVMETPLTTKEKENLDKIKDYLIEHLNENLANFADEDKVREFLRKKMYEIAKKLKVDLGNSEEKIHYHIVRDLLGFGPIEPLLRDPGIEDISCDGVRVPIYIWHRDYESIKTNIRFEDEETLANLAIKIAQRAGRHISVANPMLDSSLPDGSRVNITYSNEVTMRGTTFTIRKFKEDPLTIVDLIRWNTLSEEMAAYFWYILEFSKSILIAGGTASGKTTLLNGLAMFIKPGNKVVSIEDTAELQIPHENWIQAVARPGFGATGSDGQKMGEVSMFDLVKASLRQRPDILFVGEVRGEEAYSMFQAMSTGHAGMGTIHADSGAGVIRRLESEPMNIPRPMIQALNLICVQRSVRHQRGKKLRRTVEVVEILEVDQLTDELVTNKVFSWDANDDTFLDFGRSYVIEQIMDDNGFSEGMIKDELKRRQDVLRYLVAKNKRSYKEVSKVIFDYFADPEETHAFALQEMKRF